MSGGLHKRKRSHQDADDAGKSRQAKSERRSKNTKRTPPNQTDHDQLANGEDFVSLSETRAEKQPPGPIPARAPTRDSKSSRTKFIVFVGNLPYSTTTSQIASHFSKLAPTSIRHSTDKATGRSKGFAFLEFEGYDKMKTCLKLYHHSVFEPTPQDQEDDLGRGEESSNMQRVVKPRKINVELTVGGGGRSKGRKEKLKGKNSRLEEQRERARLKGTENDVGEGTKNWAPTDGNATAKLDDGRGAVHPSRMNRVAK